MAISAELQERYATECDVDWRNAFVLSHPNADTTYLIDPFDDGGQFKGLVDGVLCTFQPVPCQFVPPLLDDSGSQEAQILWCGIGTEARRFLDQTRTNPLVPVICRHTIYLAGNPAPQSDPFTEYAIASVTITDAGVAATVSRADLFSRQFPTEVYKLSRFPGLLRQ